MKGWLLSLLSLALLLVLMELLLSEGKTKKYIVGIVNTLLVLSFLIPLSHLIQIADTYADEATFDIVSNPAEEKETGTENLRTALERTIERELMKKNIESTVTISIIQGEITQINVWVKEIRISTEERNIYTIDTITEEVAQIVNAAKGKINVYGNLDEKGQNK